MDDNRTKNFCFDSVPDTVILRHQNLINHHYHKWPKTWHVSCLKWQNNFAFDFLSVEKKTLQSPNDWATSNLVLLHYTIHHLKPDKQWNRHLWSVWCEWYRTMTFIHSTMINWESTLHRPFCRPHSFKLVLSIICSLMYSLSGILLT